MFAILPTSYFLLPERHGQAVLSLVFMIGAITIVAGVTLAFVIVGFANSGLGAQAAHRALFAANAGVEDALMRLARNKDFSAAGYQMPIENYAVTVSVTQNAPANGQATIVSDAVVAGRDRRVQVLLDINSATGETRAFSWRELTF